MSEFSNKAREAFAEAKEKVGDLIGNERLVAEGRDDQTKVKPKHAKNKAGDVNDRAEDDVRIKD